MKATAIALTCLAIGAIAGHLSYPLLREMPDAQAACAIPRTATEVVACTLSPDQIDHLSARIAPTVVERLAASGLKGVEADPVIAATQLASSERLKREQSAAFAQATKLVDEMIARRDVSLQGRQQAYELLRQSGQADRIFEIDARISAAINRGDITPAQAGMVPSMQ